MLIKTEITTTKIARMHDRYLSFHTVTQTLVSTAGKTKVSTTEVQTGVTVFGGGLNWREFHAMTDEQYQQLMTSGACNV